MSDHSPLVSVVVVTLNNLNLLSNCLVSICAQDYESMEIIVVDNGSEKNIHTMLIKKFPEVRMVRLDRNYGFAGGNNRGIEVAQGRYIALINNDAVASPQWISSLVTTMEADDTIGAATSIIIDGNQPDVLDSCGVGISLDGMSRQAMRGKPVPLLRQPREVLLFSGCACLLRTKALDEVGLFDEEFFAYCEDTDLGLRLRRTGWKIVVAPVGHVHHYYSMTGGKFSLQKIYWVERNHLWVAIKNFPWFLLAFLPVLTGWRFILQGYSILKPKEELKDFTKNNTFLSIALTYGKAYVDLLAKLPTMLIKRRSLQAKHRLGDMDTFHLIWKFHLSINEIIGMGKRKCL